ncbi:MAG TPA: YARHG domain-containing protein, partial [Candidatus Angelobacter sp.]
MAAAVCLCAVGVLQITGALATTAARATKPQDQTARPFYYERQITADDLKDRTLRELTLMRNTIYARAGNPFRKKWLNDYFSAQSWYHPLAQMDQSKLTPLDRKNAETIADFDGSISRMD